MAILGGKMNKKAITYGIRLMIQRFLGLFLFLLASSWILNKRAAIYFSSYIALTAISIIFMYKINSITIAERGKIDTNSPMWDKVLLTLFWFLAYFLIYFIAGKTSKIGTLNTSFYIGIILYLISGILTIKAMMVNEFLESTARLQEDREQKVCSQGPYAIVRHPTYLGILIWCVSMCLIFPSKYVALVAFIIAVIIIIRTYLEDNMLKVGLKGYKEYSMKVKYKLIPFIW